MNKTGNGGVVVLPAVPGTNKRSTENDEAEGQPELGEVTVTHTTTLLLDSEVV